MNILKPTISKAVAIAAGILLLVACDDFGSLNVDPNNPSQVRTELLLTNVQRDLSSVSGAVIGNLWVQYMAETQYDDDSRYSTTTSNFNGWYTGPLMDLQTIIDLNTNEETRDDALSGGSNNNQLAVARILKAYYYHMMTDRWGMLPYSDALQGSENFSPSYDSQEAIYLDIINELNEAVDQMDGGAGVNGDIIFNGDMDAWAIFANSIRARVALRMADTNQSGLAATEFADAINSGVITEDVMYPHLAEAANQNPWFARFITRTDYALSDVLADYMIDLDDHRVLRYGDPAPDFYTEGEEITFDNIRGMPYSVENPGDITNASISFPGMAIRAQDAPLPIITVSELHFAMAEAAERGWISGDAETYYLDAIEASWNQWDVYDEGDFQNYVTNPEVAYDSGSWMEKIGTQKWVALYPNGYEAWAEWRRLGYPELEPHDFPLNQSGEIPRRQAYPTSESQINEENYDEAVSAQGPDTPDTRLWWDVN
ncbi:SusD/RagB family nutrient-binding outer membrane lipoprotein [Rhodohalobacter sp. SW132]|uniref:SusD/RagB family nutrient-binding outer membrane lipoprotein n=1 Tax=Rhodohalobacter sp. SW132 TaxID=2293433 RepID=UPI000E24CA28|nr:SusD/RagB family nutrient-binding outer membrane lipoprotein [Rhodohalobacter sp. SW132]REL29116.1 SusD/RagB family nutrient-binding outer membrane lipoprotein [Rhodohalobacter sp. SW132]